jgi:hypothetical protein
LNHIEEIDKRFLEISGIECNLKKFPLTPDDIRNNIKVDKTKSDQYGEVFTPLWLVDRMILKATVEKLHTCKSTLDLCAGWGQFTIRMIRVLANYDSSFDVYKWLKENHTFIELQLESAYKLLYIFGVDINLLIGDALEIEKVKNWNGVSYFDGHWKPISNEWLKNEIVNNEETFVKRFLEKFKEREQVILTF